MTIDDTPHTPAPPDDAGVAALLRNRQFSMVLAAAFVSNVGRWMQQVVLGIFAWELTESPTYTTQVVFAQFMPMLLLAVVGGTVADSIDRRKLLIGTQLWQAVWAIILAAMVFDGEIGEGTLLLVVFLTGLAQAFFGPAFSAVLPSLAGPGNLAQAISLNSTQINASRVIGPAIGAWLASQFDVWLAFAVNGATYLVIITALAVVKLPPQRPVTGSALERLTSGFRIARRAEQIRVPLAVMATFALLCLPFIGLMPVIAELSLGIDARSTRYGVLYGIFGLGAVVGAASVSTVLRSFSSQAVVRGTLAGFAVSLAVLASLRSVTFAYPVMFSVGMFYFTMPTALTTFMQLHLADEIRGRIMALWMLSFGGVIPINNLLSGPAVEVTSLTTVLLFGAMVAVVLGIVVRLRPGPEYGDILTGH
ncbi:MAG: MFS transporter [Actinomycetota bacterium]